MSPQAVPPLYLDANASEPPLPAALHAAHAALSVVGNPSSPHALGRRARALLDDARDAVALLLGGRSREVVFTSGASEANRWLVDALSLAFQRDQVVVTSPLEHPSLRKPLTQAMFSVAQLSCEGESLVLDPELLSDADALVITAAHNETGLVTQLEALLALVPERTVVCVDAAQAAGRLPPLPERVDAIVCSAHKLGGLAGSGALLLRGRARALPAPWSGGGQEGNLRPGTENVVGIAAFGAAAAQAAGSRAAALALRPLRDQLERALVPAWGARVLCAGQQRLPQTSALAVPGVDGEALRIALDLAGVCVGFGAACSALAPEPSPGLQALGLSAAEARATVRVSLPLGTTEADVQEALVRMGPVVAGLVRATRS